mgnify:FL=1
MHFKNAPEAGEGEASENGRNSLIGHKQRGDCNQKAHKQPDPPTPLAHIILHLDNRRMADTDAKKYGSADYDSTKVHLQQGFISDSAPVSIASGL